MTKLGNIEIKVETFNEKEITDDLQMATQIFRR